MPNGTCAYFTNFMNFMGFGQVTLGVKRAWCGLPVRGTVIYMV
jgi:hypothetical protein